MSAHCLTHTGVYRSDFNMMSQHKHYLYQGWMCWSHTQTKRHNNRPIMSCVAVQWRRQGRGESGWEGGRVETKMSERVWKWVREGVSERVCSDCTLRARAAHSVLCFPLTFHMTWEDVEQSAGSAEVQYKYTHIHIHEIKSDCGTYTCKKKKRNISTQAQA